MIHKYETLSPIYSCIHTTLYFKHANSLNRAQNTDQESLVCFVYHAGRFHSYITNLYSDDIKCVLFISQTQSYIWLSLSEPSSIKWPISPHVTVSDKLPMNNSTTVMKTNVSQNTVITTFKHASQRPNLFCDLFNIHPISLHFLNFWLFFVYSWFPLFRLKMKQNIYIQLQ